MYDHPSLPRRPAHPSWGDVFNTLLSFKIPLPVYLRYNAKLFRKALPPAAVSMTSKYPGVMSNLAHVHVTSWASLEVK